MSLQDLWEMMSFGGNESYCSSGMSTNAININTAGRNAVSSSGNIWHGPETFELAVYHSELAFSMLP
jgi:hypothetical protein